MNIGDLIIKRRKLLGLTQKELAKDICTQSTISKIEKNTLIPNSQLLKEFAEKLEVSVSYFYGEEVPTKNDKEIKDLIKKVQLTLNQNENKKTLEIIEHNETLINSLIDTNHIRFFEMIEAHLDYHLFNQKDKAVNDLIALLKYKQLSDQLKIDIFSILAIIYYEEKDFEESAKYFEKSLELFDVTIPFKTRVRILYNYALNLEELDQDKKAMDTVLEGIELLKKHQSMYSLGYFYSYKAYLFSKVNDFDEAIKSYEKSAVIFDILNYPKMYAFVRLSLSELIKKEEDKNEKNS